jgi:hypothetical protein
MKDIIIKINKETRKVDLTKTVIGNDSENLQGNLVFAFTDEFVDGTARLEYEISNENGYIMLLKQDETYYIPIKSILTKKGQINMQLVITEGTNENEIPVFKSNVFYMTCNKSINAEIETPDEYSQWIDIANAKLNELEEAIKEIGDIDRDITNVEQDITILKNESGTKVTLSINDDYLMTLNLINANGEVVSTANIDFPIESMIVNAGYSNGILTLTLQNGNKLNVDISDIIKGLVSETTFLNAVKELENKIENNIGREIQLDFNAVLENNEIIANLDETIKDYELQNNTGYLFHIYLPLVTLTGDLNNDYPIYLMDKDFNKVNINTIFQKDITKTSTVGDMCQIQDYDIGIGYSWEFYGHFRKINNNGNEINVIYTDTIVRETNSSLTGEQLHKDVVNSKLKVGTTVLCLSDYGNNGSKYEKGHTYLIENESDTEEIILIATDITALYDDTEIKQNIADINREQEDQNNKIEEINTKNTEQDTELTTLQEEKTDLEERVSDLEKNTLKGEAEGENIALSDSADMRFESIEISGNSEQETRDITDDSGEVIGTMPSLDYPSDVKSCGDNGSINEVVCNKNLFDMNKCKFQAVSASSLWHRSDLIPAKKNTNYILSGSLLPSSYTERVDLYNYKKEFISSISIGNANSKYKFTTTEDARYFSVNGYSKYIDVSTIQVEEGDTVTNYVVGEQTINSIPVQQPFRKIGDYADEFIKKARKWYERHYNTEIVVDGINYLAVYVFPNGRFNIRDSSLANAEITNALPATAQTALGNVMCNKLKTITQQQLSSSSLQGIEISTTGTIGVKLDNSTADTNTWTAETINTFLQENPLKINYTMVEPIDLECTQEQIEALEKLEKAKTYKNITHIFSTDEVSANVKVGYYKDNETVLNNLLTRIETLESEVG